MTELQQRSRIFLLRRFAPLPVLEAPVWGQAPLIRAPPLLAGAFVILWSEVMMSIFGVIAVFVATAAVSLSVCAIVIAWPRR